MTEMVSPGVYVSESDQSEIATNVSAIAACFAGNFTKGPLEEYTQITNTDDLISFYGKPTDENYNDWYQAYNYLQYADNLYISRACNINGYANDTMSTFVAYETAVGYSIQKWGTSEYGGVVNDKAKWVFISNETDIQEGDIVVFGESETDVIEAGYPKFLVVEVRTGTRVEDGLEVPAYALLLDRSPTMLNGHTEVSVSKGMHVYKLQVALNGSSEVQSYNNSTDMLIPWKKTSKATYSCALRIPDYLDNSQYYNSEATIVEEDKEDIDTGDWYTETHSEFLKKKPTRTDKTILFATNRQIKNHEHFNLIKDSIAFANATSKLKFFSRTPGTVETKFKICIALPSDFEVNDVRFVGNHCSRYAFEGIALDGLYEYAPVLETAQIAVIVYDSLDEEIKETFLVSLDPKDVDSYGKSIYIEDVINTQSSLIYVKDNKAVEPLTEVEEYVLDVYGNKIQKTVTVDGKTTFVTSIDTVTGKTVPVYRTRKVKVPNVSSYTFIYDSINNKYYGRNIELSNAYDSPIQADDLLDACEVFDNKEAIDIDIIIANELDNGISAKKLAETRGDCIAYMGIPYEYNGKIMTTGQKAATSTANIVKFRNSINYNSMWISLYANYKQQYDRYNSVNRWINIAGDIAGLRGKCSVENNPWIASAGLDRGQIKNAIQLSYSPNKTQRDTLYQNCINPVLTFPSEGDVIWGQKTMLSKSSSFNRVNIRNLFNILERTLAKMSRNSIFEQNDSFTRNRILAKINPYLSQVQSDRGIDDYKTICDETNNTSQTIAENKLVVDIFIKPTYAVEMIHLKFTNAGTNDFSTIIDE